MSLSQFLLRRRMTEETNTTKLPDIFHEITNAPRHFPQHFGLLWFTVTGSLFWKLKSSLRNRREKKSWNEKIFLLPPPFSCLWISLYYIQRSDIYLWLLCVKYKNSKCRRHQIITSRETRPLRLRSQNIHGRANIDVSWRSAKMLFLLTIRLLWKSPTHGNLQT